MKTFAASRWFALVDLACALVSAAVWYSWSRGYFRSSLAAHPADVSWLYLLKAGWPLLIALIPWMLRIGAGSFPFKRTRFDLFLILFLASAGAGVWAAYDREAAWAKFWVLLGGVFLYYALSGQPGENLWLVAGLLGLFGAVLAGVFLLRQDFQKQYTDLDILRPVVSAWMFLRPPVRYAELPPNIVGGWLALLAPFPIACGLASWRRRWLPGVLASLVFTFLIGFALILTSSRGAWAALLLALVVWALFSLGSRIYRFSAFQEALGRLGQRARAPEQVRAPAFILTFFLLAGLSFGLVLARPDLLLELVNRLPGLPSGGSRLGLVHDSLYLIADFPFTGGGLAAFAGLYSQYIMIIPVFLFGYSHNLFLDVAIDQGIFGLLALSVIFLGSLFLSLSTYGRSGSWQYQSSRFSGANGWTPAQAFHLLSGAVLAGLIVVGLHGLVDDALYSSLGSPGVFILPGLAIALSEVGCQGFVNKQTKQDWHRPNGLIIFDRTIPGHRFRREGWILAGLASLSVASLAAIWWKPLLSEWYANHGAAEMARAELAGFPLENWDAERTRQVLESKGIQSAVNSFDRSLALNPGNATARYRMGLISLGRGNFTSAILHLEAAHRALPGHRGVIKVLGYSYVWVGKMDLALPLLGQIPEAQGEMDVYSWWWKERGRADLANQSAQMSVLLANAGGSIK